MAERVQFVVTELGADVDPFLLHPYAALAEKQRRLISQRLHPVSTAGSSLARFRAGKQTGIGFIDLDELGEVIDAEACKGGCRFFAEAENSETTVFRIQYNADLVQPLLILAEHFSDTADREDVADPGHGQAA
jgi:hypothetical protein